MASRIALESGELYTVGWIAALSKELTAALAMLDERHDKPKDFVKPSSDTNAYRWGRIGGHNVVIASLAAGVYGTTSAATTAIHMISSFPSIKVGLMVGIGAAIPGPKHDIRLGDVVVSKPHGKTGGVVQYDLGKSRASTAQGNTVHAFERVGFLRPPPEALLKALSLLQAEVDLDGSSIPQVLEDMLGRYPRLAQKGPGYVYQGVENDRLFETSYLHTSDIGCGGCDSTRMVPRSARSNPSEPEVHYGVIASGNKLVKDAAERDMILKDSGEECICLEMEAAGLMNSFPCLIIRGICDYADSHKNDDWQEYAAATAAAYAKEFLGYVDNGDLARTTKASEILKEISEDLSEMRTNIKTTGATVQELRLDNQQERLDNQREKIVRWLSAPDPSINHNNAREKCHEGTGLWFVSSETFERWKMRPKSFLWLHGIPGRGKTILSSTIIEHLKSNIEPNRPLLYFYFDFSDTNKQTFENMLRSLVSQLYQTQLEARGPLDEIWRSHGSNQQISKQSLSTVLLAMLSKVNNTSIVLDALDESTTTSDVIDWSKSFLELGSSCRIIVTARREEDIETAFRRWAQPEDMISIRESDIDGDIRSYISHTVRNSSELERWREKPDVQNEIESKLVEKADGMFRWVFCQLDALKDCFDYPRLRLTLSNLPGTLNETYSRILDQIPGHLRTQATTVLNLLIWSDDRLTLNALVDAVAVDLDHEPGFDPKNRMPVPREVLKLCSSLVTVYQLPWGVDVIRIAHFSVKEYLISDLVSKAYESFFSETLARVYLARLCLTYLISVRPIIPPRPTCYGALIDLGRREFPFVDYSSVHWQKHARGIENKDEELWRLLVGLFVERPEELRFLQFREYLQDCGGIVASDDIEEWASGPISYASSCGLTQVVEYLVDEGTESDAITAHEYLEESLRLASQRGYNTTVELLLDKGADVNAGHGAALQEASQRGNDITVRLLLDRGADANAKDGAALLKASEYGNVAVVRLLLDRGADVNAGDGAALIGAAKHHEDTIVRLLLDRGADANAGDGIALRLAAEHGLPTILQLLLDHGSAIKARHENGENALMATLKNHQKFYDATSDE
ncbi:hypothetical protein QM012_003764 [Aureobasidium pullulans]|uniref:Pfs, NACHT and ankyrin domain protein n=1 Tax=Aureobasidium pullulans TaxID=5580 RepID=A0ABR0T7W4_AURPU